MNKLKKFAPQPFLYLGCCFLSYLTFREVDMINRTLWGGILIWMLIRTIQSLENKLNKSDKRILYIETEVNLLKSRSQKNHLDPID